MVRETADIIVKEFEAGRLSRRQLIAQLTAIGAVAAGAGISWGAKPGRGDDESKGRTSADGEPSTFKASSVDHLALNVTEIPRSRDWYVRHLGLRVTREGETSCFLSAGERDFLALFKAQKPGLHHYSFAIPDYDQKEAARKLREAGLTPKLRGGRTYFDDPDGIEVQVSPE
jgi:hypothetical protein